MTREHSPPMDVITDMRSSPPEQFLPEPPSPTSSEPALFSSDDPVEAEDVNNYASPRTKRKHVGPWWHAAVDTPGPAKKSKNMERNFDSAVWMWSDEFDESDELPTLLDREPEPDLTDIAFHNIVQNGISQGQLSYDLSKYGAEDYHLHNLDALTSVIRNPPDPGNELPAEGQYRSMIPQLVLFLSRNRLKYLAPNLFQLEYVTHLVLSHNCIEVLSPCIGQMQNLEALDVSHNRLTYLPREICQLLSPQGNLEQLNVHGNPLLELVDDTSYSVMARQIFSRIHSREGLLQTLYNTVERKDLQDPSAPFFATLISCLESRIRNDRTERHLASRSDVLPSRLTYVASTPTAYSDYLGLPVSGTPTLPKSCGDPFTPIFQTTRSIKAFPPQTFTPPPESRVPRLLILSLESALQNVTPDEVRDMMKHNDFPALKGILAQADANWVTMYKPLKICNACRREYIVTRASWIEFWSVGSGRFVPFKCETCSYGCAEDMAGARDI